MAKWKIEYTSAAKKDLKKLDNTQQRAVFKALDKVSVNPLPENEGGYGKPLGNHSSSKLSGLLKIKLLSMGIRVVYRLERVDDVMTIIIVGMRSDDEVYKEAEKRIKKSVPPT